MSPQIKLSDLLSTEEIAKYSKSVKEQLEKMLNLYHVVNSPKERKLYLIKTTVPHIQKYEANNLKYIK